jgi:hypothetical protein
MACTSLARHGRRSSGGWGILGVRAAEDDTDDDPYRDQSDGGQALEGRDSGGSPGSFGGGLFLYRIRQDRAHCPD